MKLDKKLYKKRQKIYEKLEIMICEKSHQQSRLDVSTVMGQVMKLHLSPLNYLL